MHSQKNTRMAKSNIDFFARRKLALIIGNNNYSQPWNKLQQSINNANDLKFAVKSINFDVTQYIDVDHSMMEKVQHFSEKINDGDLVLFYFSGHVCSINKKNFFIPIDDTQIRNDIDVKLIGFSVEKTLERLTKENSSGVTVFILDYYRSYMMVSSANIDNTGGLYPMRPSENTVIQFAWEGHQIRSNDGEIDRNSLYTKHLLKNIKKKNLDIRQMFQQIADGVQRESNGKQKPLSMHGLADRSSVYFNEVLIVKKPHNNLQLQNRLASASFRSPLNLSKLPLIDADMEVVVEQAIVGKQCVWLRLEENKLTPAGISILVTAFQKKNSLEGLGLFGNQLSDAGVQALSLALSSSRNRIKSLGLGNNGITDTGAGYLANMLKTNRTITQLCLQKNQMTDQGIQLLFDTMGMYATHIQELDLSNNMLVTDASVNAFCNLIEQNEALKQLWISGCSLTPQGKEQIVTTKKTKKLFDLRV